MPDRCLIFERMCVSMKRKYAAIVLSMAMVLSPVGVLAADNTAEASPAKS